MSSNKYVWLGFAITLKLNYRPNKSLQYVNALRLRDNYTNVKDNGSTELNDYLVWNKISVNSVIIKC